MECDACSVYEASGGWCAAWETVDVDVCGYVCSAVSVECDWSG